MKCIDLCYCQSNIVKYFMYLYMSVSILNWKQTDTNLISSNHCCFYPPQFFNFLHVKLPHTLRATISKWDFEPSPPHRYHSLLIMGKSLWEMSSAILLELLKTFIAHFIKILSHDPLPGAIIWILRANRYPKWVQRPSKLLKRTFMLHFMKLLHPASSSEMLQFWIYCQSII